MLYIKQYNSVTITASHVVVNWLRVIHYFIANYPHNNHAFLSKNLFSYNIPANMSSISNTKTGIIHNATYLQAPKWIMGFTNFSDKEAFGFGSNIEHVFTWKSLCLRDVADLIVL